MGNAAKEQAHAKHDKKVVAKENSSRRVKASASETADWGGVDPAALVDAVQSVTLKGGALRLSYTRDGGAYCIGILGDGEPYNDYVKPSEDIDEYLRRLAENWRA